MLRQGIRDDLGATEHTLDTVHANATDAIDRDGDDCRNMKLSRAMEVEFQIAARRLCWQGVTFQDGL